MDYLYEYLAFLAQAVTIVIAIVVIISAIAGAAMKQTSDEHEGHLAIKKLNDEVTDLRHAMEGNLLPPDEAKKLHKQEAKQAKQKAKQQARQAGHKPSKQSVDQKASASSDAIVSDGQSTQPETAIPERVFVVHFDGDVKASPIEHFRREISAILTLATAQDEVVACIESPGGMVHSYGLAASQLARIRAKEIPLTVVVDRVAASGGYLMAVVANKILAAPFALIGSIGVVAQVPNVHRLLKKNDVDVEVLTAGKYKRTLTVFGENTKDGRQKFLEELEDVHLLFQEYVAENRPGLDVDKVATGEAWYGKRALALNLIDGLSTSDEYLLDRCAQSDVYEVKWIEQKKPIDRLLGKINGMLDRATQLMDTFRTQR